MQIAKRTMCTLLLLFFVLGMVIVALSFGKVARLVPLVIGIPTCLLLGLQLLIDTCPIVANKFSAFHAGTRKEHSEEKTQGSSLPMVLFWAFLLLVGYKLGYVWAVPIVLFLYFKIQAKESWKLSLSLSSGVGIFVYLIFYVFMGFKPY